MNHRRLPHAAASEKGATRGTFRRGAGRQRAYREVLRREVRGARLVSLPPTWPRPTVRRTLPPRLPFFRLRGTNQCGLTSRFTIPLSRASRRCNAAATVDERARCGGCRAAALLYGRSRAAPHTDLLERLQHTPTLCGVLHTRDSHRPPACLLGPPCLPHRRRRSTGGAQPTRLHANLSSP